MTEALKTIYNELAGRIVTAAEQRRDERIEYAATDVWGSTEGKRRYISGLERLIFEIVSPIKVIAVWHGPDVHWAYAGAEILDHVAGEFPTLADACAIEWPTAGGALSVLCWHAYILLDPTARRGGWLKHERSRDTTNYAKDGDCISVYAQDGSPVSILYTSAAGRQYGLAIDTVQARGHDLTTVVLKWLEGSPPSFDTRQP